MQASSLTRETLETPSPCLDRLVAAGEPLKQAENVDGVWQDANQTLRENETRSNPKSEKLQNIKHNKSDKFHIIVKIFLCVIGILAALYVGQRLLIFFSKKVLHLFLEKNQAALNVKN